MIYLTAIGYPSGGSSTVHIYIQTIQRTTQNKQYIQHKNEEECGPCPIFAGFTLAFALQLRKIESHYVRVTLYWARLVQVRSHQKKTGSECLPEIFLTQNMFCFSVCVVTCIISAVTRSVTAAAVRPRHLSVCIILPVHPVILTSVVGAL